MKIVLLSGGMSNPFGASIAQRLKQQGNDIAMVVVKKKITWANTKRIYFSYNLSGLWSKVINKYIRRKKPPCNKSRQSENQQKIPVDKPIITLKEIIKNDSIPYIRVRDGNDPYLLKKLESLQPDILIYAGIGILRKKLLKIPRLGVLNAHMGLLPEYRGMNVLEWSLYNRQPVGITIHFIDEGIDTGNIILTKTIEIEPADTIETLRDKSNPSSVEGLAEAIKILQQPSFQPQTQTAEEGRQYFVMHDKLKKLINKRLLSDRR